MPVAAVSQNASGRKARAVVMPRRRRPPARPRTLTARELEMEFGEKIVQAPWEAGAQECVKVNRRVDVLEEELANRRIGLSQYETGRIVQAVFERASGARLGSGGWNAGGSRDQTIAHELAIIYAIEDAETIQRYVRRIERAIGVVGTRFLRAILAERTSLKSYAAARGKSGERGLAQVAGHFRLLLEGLDEAWAARGATVFEEDAKGELHPRILAQRAAASSIETDERGRVVPKGKGFRWGRSES